MSADAGRSQWGGKLEFILTCVGYAVGLGNVWRFPYLVYQNGGGAFLIPYTLMLFLVGLPVFYMEICLGQFGSLGPITIWKAVPIFKGLGLASVIVAAYITIYYNVINAWSLYYFFASMTDKLPWATCNNAWNSDLCIDGKINRTGLDNETLANLSRISFRTSSEDQNVLQISSGIEVPGHVVWQLACTLLIAWTIVFIVLLRGIESLGKVMYFVSLFPYVLLTILLINSAQLPGASEGIKFYMTPNWQKLLEPQVWGDAATQIFYSLGCCMGGLIAMASFNKFNNNVMRDALIIPFVNCGTSLYAGFVIFSVLGYMAQEKGVPVQDVVAQGPGLVFVVYPEGLKTMPGAPAFAIMFFFMMGTLGFSSQFSTAEGVIAAAMDEFPALKKGRRPMMLRGLLCASFFLLGLPMVTQGGFYLFDIINNYSAGYPLNIVGLGELFALMVVYRYRNFADDVSMMLGKKPQIFWRATWLVISPVLLIVTLVFRIINQGPLKMGSYTYPGWANAIAWLIVAFPLTAMFLVAAGVCLKKGGYTVLKGAISPENDWGPVLEEHRTGKYATSTKEIELSYSTDNPTIVAEETVQKSAGIPDYTEPGVSGLVDKDIGLNKRTPWLESSTQL